MQINPNFVVWKHYEPKHYSNNSQKKHKYDHAKETLRHAACAVALNAFRRDGDTFGRLKPHESVLVLPRRSSGGFLAICRVSSCWARQRAIWLLPLEPLCSLLYINYCVFIYRHRFDLDRRTWQRWSTWTALHAAYRWNEWPVAVAAFEMDVRGKLKASRVWRTQQNVRELILVSSQGNYNIVSLTNLSIVSYIKDAIVN